LTFAGDAQALQFSNKSFRLLERVECGVLEGVETGINRKAKPPERVPNWADFAIPSQSEQVSSGCHHALVDNHPNISSWLAGTFVVERWMHLSRWSSSIRQRR
jgi:hypothetical protein